MDSKDDIQRMNCMTSELRITPMKSSIQKKCYTKRDFAMSTMRQRIVEFFSQSCFCCFLGPLQDYADEDGEDEAELPDITPEMEDDINAALGSPSSVTLVSAFREGGLLI